jgi:transmembrane sensor
MKQKDFPLSELDIENAHRVAYLIAGYIRNTLTPAEHHELDEWVATSDHNMELFEKLTDEDNLERAMQ